MYHLLAFVLYLYAVDAMLVENGHYNSRFRIIGGNEIDIKKAPYQVSIRRKNLETSITYDCGGSIISNNSILTAAHCAMSKDDVYIVRSGTTFFTEDGKIHNVTDIVIHEKFNITAAGTAVFDIAILKVDPGFNFDDEKEQIIELADDEAQNGDVAYVTGWGVTEKNEPSSHLKGLSVKIIDIEKCKKDYAYLGSSVDNMNEHNICAEYPGGTQNICNGDSGGALVVKGKQVGITSWVARGCAIPGQPAVYAAVAKYRDWIDKHIKT